MAVAQCVANILEFKKILLRSYKRTSADTDIAKYYYDLLNSQSILNEVQKLNFNLRKKNKHATYINNYFNASLISTLLQKEGYSLENWLLYSENVFKSLINNSNYSNKLGSFNESKVLELFILHTVNSVFNIDNIIALKANSDNNPTKLLKDNHEEGLNPKVANKIIQKVKITMKIRGKEEVKVWGDNDVLIVASPPNSNDADVICIISCKTSLRERVYQSIFWATHSRIEGIAKHTLVTLDKGDDGKKSEIKNDTDKKIRKTRIVLESTMDRVYVLRGAHEVNRSFVIKDFDHLKDDLIQWRKDHFGL